MQVKGFTGPIFKKFSTVAEAEEFIREKQNSQTASTSSIFSVGMGMKRPYSNQNSSDPKPKKSKIDIDKTTEFTKDVCKMARYGKYDFMQDSDGFVQVYTDGSCENNGKATAAAGKGVWFGDGHAL